MKAFIKKLFVLFAIQAIILSAAKAQSDFQLNGNAVQTGPTCYQLTTETTFIYGSIWNKQKIDLGQDFIINTSMNFGRLDANGADGIVFAFQGLCTNAGSNGEGIGIGGVSPSLFVEIDTYQNSGNPHNDPAEDHISIFKNGTNNHGDANNLSTTVQASATSANIEDNTYHTVRFTWIAATQTLSVFFDGAFRTSYTGDAVTDIFGGNPFVYYGFTAATGGSVNNQSVCIVDDPDVVICQGSSTPLTVTGAGTFTWSPSSSLNKSTGNTVIANPTTTTTYTVTSIDGGCAPVSFTVKVIVIPTPDVSASNQAVCNNTSSVIMKFTGVTTSTTFAWTNDNTSIGLAASGTGDIPVFTAKNPGTSVITATITVTPTDGNCVGAPKTFTYTINPTPDVTPPADQALCNTFQTTLASFSSSVSGTTFSWANNKTSVGLASSGNGNIAAFTATNTGSANTTATITVTPIFAGCSGTAKTFTYTVYPTPTLVLPANQILCNTVSSAAVTLSGPVAGSIFDWTNNQTSIGLGASGTGNMAAFVTSNTSTSPVIATVTVTPKTATCAGADKTFTYTINPTPDVIIPADQVICNTTATPFASFSSSVSGTTYAWTNNKTSIGLVASGTGDIQAFTATNNGSTDIIATVSVKPTANNCPGPAKTFTITVHPTPFANAPADTTVCETQTSMNIKGSAKNFDAVSWSGGANSFAPVNDTTSVYTFSASDIQAGNVKLTLKVDKASCASVTDAITISFEKLATITATDKEICETETSVALTSVISNAANTTWTTADGAGNITQNGTNGINYTINPHDTTLTDINFNIKTDGQVKCPAATASLKLKLTDRPYIQATSETICENTSALALTLKAKNIHSVTWTAINANGTFTKTDDLHGQYIPAGADTLKTVLIGAQTINNPVCAAVKDTFKITVIGKPLLVITDQQLCNNFKTTQIVTSGKHISAITWTNITGNGVVTTGEGHTYTYQKGNADSLLTAIQVQGTTVNDGACPSVSDILNIKLQQIHTARISAALTCDLTKGIDLNGAILNNPTVTGTWTSTGAGTVTASATDFNANYAIAEADKNKTVSFSFTSGNNGVCPLVKIDTSIVITGEAVAIIGKDTSICKNSPVVLNTSLSKNIATFNWTNAAGTIISTKPIDLISFANTDSLILNIQNAAGCKDSDTLTVHIISMPVLALDAKKCIEPNLVLNPMAQFSDPENYTANISWTKDKVNLGLSTATITASDTGTYKVIYQYPGCFVADSIHVLALPVIVTRDYIICQGLADSIGTKNLIKNAFYKWSDGVQGKELNIRPVTINNVLPSYTVTVTDKDNCVNSASFNVNYTQKPVLVTTGQDFCKGTSGTAAVQVSNISTTNAVVTYQWTFNGKDLNQNANTITVNTAGKYTIMVSFGDCASKDAVTLSQYDLPVRGMKSSYIFCTDNTAGLELKAVDGYTYDWAHNHESTQNILVMPTENGWYKVTLINEHACKITDSTWVKISCPPRVFAANVITPDKNDENRYLKVFGDHYNNLELMVFNRWGEVIFKSSPERPDWDGTYAGEIMPVGTYPYTVNYIGKYEEYPGPYKMEGKVTIIR